MKRVTPDIRGLGERALATVRAEPLLGSLGDADLAAALEIAALLARNGRRLMVAIEQAARLPTSDPEPLPMLGGPRPGRLLVCPVCEGAHVVMPTTDAVQCSCGGVAEAPHLG